MLHLQQYPQVHPPPPVGATGAAGLGATGAAGLGATGAAGAGVHEGIVGYAGYPDVEHTVA